MPEIEKKPWTICTQEELKLLAQWLGVRDDWHEPDEQGVNAELHGGHLDNAGFSGSAELERRRNDPHPMGRRSTERDLEFWVTITKDGEPVAEIDVATLLAFACGTYDGSKMNPRNGGMRSHWAWVIRDAMQHAAKRALGKEEQ